jgi:hypothetical protein
VRQALPASGQARREARRQRVLLSKVLYGVPMHTHTHTHTHTHSLYMHSMYVFVCVCVCVCVCMCVCVCVLCDHEIVSKYK